MVNSGKLIGTAKSDAIDQVTHKPMSLWPGSTAVTLRCEGTITHMIYKVPRHKGVGGMEVNLYAFFTLTVDRNEWWASRRGRFTPWEWTVDNLRIGINVTDRPSEIFGEGECLLLLSKITVLFLVYPTHILVTLPTELFYSDACVKLRNVSFGNFIFSYFIFSKMYNN